MICKENPQKAEAIVALANVYKKEYEEDWAKEYQADLTKFAGNGILNCLEFRGGRLLTAKPEAPAQEVVQDKPLPKPEECQASIEQEKIEIKEDKDSRLVSPLLSVWRCRLFYYIRADWRDWSLSAI